MAQIKNHYLKFVFFLFCLSQVHGASNLSPRLISSQENPFSDFIKEVSKSTNAIAEKLQLRLNEADIHIDKYIDDLKEKIDVTEGTIQESLAKLEEVFEKFGKQVCEVIPKQFERLIDELKAKDPEVAEKVKKLRAELVQLKDDLIKLYEETKKPVLDRYNEIKDEVISKSKPIVKRYTPLVKDIEEIILTLIPEKKQSKKN